jgi:hypothetical protein
VIDRAVNRRVRLRRSRLGTSAADIAYDVHGPLPTAELLGQQAIVFPSHHGGFVGGESGCRPTRSLSRANCATSSTTIDGIVYRFSPGATIPAS